MLFFFLKNVTVQNISGLIQNTWYKNILLILFYFWILKLCVCFTNSGVCIISTLPNSQAWDRRPSWELCFESVLGLWWPCETCGSSNETAPLKEIRISKRSSILQFRRERYVLFFMLIEEKRCSSPNRSLSLCVHFHTVPLR